MNFVLPTAHCPLFTHMPTDASQIDKVNFPAPGKIGRRVNAETRIFLVKLQARNRRPPGVEICDVDANHEIAGKLFVIEVLENKLRVAIAKTSVAAVLPHLFKTKIGKQATARLVVAAARDKGQ